MRNKIWKWMNGSRFRRNFLKITQANIISQILLLGAMPILTRLYSPENFGTAAIFASILAIATSICNWRYSMAVPNGSSLRFSAALIYFGTLILYSFFLLLLLMVWIRPGIMRYWAGIESLGVLIFFLPFAVLFSGLQQLLHGWFIRLSNMQPVGNQRLVYTITYLGGALLFAMAGYTDGGLIAGNVAGLLASVFILGIKADLLFSTIRSLTKKRIIAAARTVLGFTSKATGVSLVNIISLSIAVILLAQHYSQAEIGQYSLMLSLVITPVRSITQALALSFWSRAAELARNMEYQQLKRLYHKLLFALFLVTLPIIAICSQGQYFLVPIFGEQWEGTHLILLAITPQIMGNILFSSTNHLFVLKTQHLQLVADSSRIVLMLFFIYLASIQQWPFELAVFTVSLASLIGHLLLYGCHLISYWRLKGNAST